MAMKKFFRRILPATEVDARVELFSMDKAEELLSGNPDYVLDCIDNIHTKVDLLRYCYDHKIKVLPLGVTIEFNFVILFLLHRSSPRWVPRAKPILRRSKYWI
jgi:molybdopterin/thiamine biosynthesis adenylyltransferase